MSTFAFLNAVTVSEVEVGRGKTGSVKKNKNPNPTTYAIRIWDDGSVYPSQALVEKFNLEYPKATVSTVTLKDGTNKAKFTVVGDQGNAFDVIPSDQFTQIKTDGQFIALAIVPKDSPKVDLFGSTRYDETGNPLSSVMDQGAASFGKDSFLPMLQRIYGLVPNAEGFIDMTVSVTIPDTVTEVTSILRPANGINLLPKVVSRGADKGKPDYVRRENATFALLIPAVEIANVPASTEVTEPGEPTNTMELSTNATNL